MLYPFLLLMSIMTQLAIRTDGGKLLPQWPEKGPPLLFEISDLGNGYSSPAITNDRIFITGECDSTGYLFAFNKQGQLLWKSIYGKEWVLSFPGSRGAPTVVDDLVYVCSGMGVVSCFNAVTGKKTWGVDIIKDLEGVNVTFGYAMPLVVHEDKLFCSPGGKKNNIVALSRYNGELLWSSPAKKETGGYGSPLIIELAARTVLVTSSEFCILGLDTDNGDLLWSYELAFKGELPCNQPVFDGKNLYWVAGPGNGAVAAQLSTDGSEIEVQWKNSDFDTFFGGFVKKDDYLYGSSDSKRKYISVDDKSGRIKKSLSFSIGSLIAADHMFIAYNQRGQVGLIRSDEGRMELLSNFRITRGTKEHFSHPVYYDGILYIRHGNVLLAYNISTKE